MSDSPQGPDWWRATDGRWYPPELFTGPPELRPGARRAAETTTTGPAAVEPATPVVDEPEPTRPARRGPSRPVVLLIAALVVLAGIAGAVVLLGGGDDGGDSDDAASSPGSTSTGPVQVEGTVALRSSVPPGTITPRSCEEWATLVRVEVQDADGAALSNFVPEVASGGDAERAEDGTESLECTFDYAANVPADPSYSVALIDVRGGGRAMLVETVDGAEEGGVAGPDLVLSYACERQGGGATCQFSRG